MAELRGDLRVAEGRRRQPSASLIDSQSVRTTGRGLHGINAYKKVGGRKRHILVATLDLILAVVIIAADAQDPNGDKWCSSRSAADSAH